jgi:hypothetical protein
MKRPWWSRRLKGRFPDKGLFRLLFAQVKTNLLTSLKLTPWRMREKLPLEYTGFIKECTMEVQMKILVAYLSQTGNTKKVAQFLMKSGLPRK